MRSLAARVAALICVDAVWLASEPTDMRARMETALARAAKVFGTAQPHHAHLFANRRANRMKVRVHDGIGICLRTRCQSICLSSLKNRGDSANLSEFDCAALCICRMLASSGISHLIEGGSKHGVESIDLQGRRF